MKKFKYIDKDTGVNYLGDVNIADVPSLNDKIINYDSHISNSNVHVTLEDKDYWNNGAHGLKPLTNCFYVDAGFIENTAPYFSNLTDAINASTNNTLIFVNGTFTIGSITSTATNVRIFGYTRSEIDISANSTINFELNLYEFKLIKSLGGTITFSQNLTIMDSDIQALICSCNNNVKIKRCDFINTGSRFITSNSYKTLLFENCFVQFSGGTQGFIYNITNNSVIIRNCRFNYELQESGSFITSMNLVIVNSEITVNKSETVSAAKIIKITSGSTSIAFCKIKDSLILLNHIGTNDDYAIYTDDDSYLIGAQNLCTNGLLRGTVVGTYTRSDDFYYLEGITN